ncbi:DUF6596 domain-containing protein [Thalassococcus sp. S3]|uniref:DUF6596 domain-containing protein n=1 Tax=Thalassococcus sp. S3 TaxID=2017482 RepID=UPI00352F7C94
MDPSDDLGHEAMFLADMLVRLRPDDPEARGLAALIAMTQARRDARVVEGCLVPVPEQDTKLWDHALNRYALRHLSIAQAQRRPGRFQIEAAIQAVHVHRHETGRTDWQSLLALYDGLWALCPTPGVAVARVSVLSHVEGPEVPLEVLNRIKGLEVFQPAHALRADILARKGQEHDACQSYQKAISLTVEPALRRYLEKQRSQISRNTADKSPSIYTAEPKP